MGLSRKLRCRFVGVGVALVVMATAQPVFAGGRESAKERAAHKACLAGDYATGVSILSDLFLASKDPTYLFNQSRCLQQAGQFSAAVLHFQEFLRVGGEKLSAADRAEAEKHIADCQAQLAKQNPQPEPPLVPVAPAEPQPVFVQAPTIVQPAPSEPTSNGPGLRTAGIVAAGVGVAGIITGVIFNLKANSIADSYGTRGTYTQGKESNRSNYQTLGWVGYGVGSACIAAGAVLYFVGRSTESARSVSVVLGPSVAPGTAGAVVKGSF